MHLAVSNVASYHNQREVSLTHKLTHKRARLSLVFSIKSLAPRACMNMELAGNNTPSIDSVIIIKAFLCLSLALTLLH